jgi:hypothetical protein
MKYMTFLSGEIPVFEAYKEQKNVVISLVRRGLAVGR